MTTIHRKAVPVEFKAVDEDQGIVEAIVSVFGNVDLGGDRVVKGAFEDSIAKWKASGKMVPVVWSHEWNDLWSHIGYADPSDMKETDVGLHSRYHLDINDNPAAAQAFRLMKRGTVKEHSFAYMILDAKTAKDGANELRKLDIIEIGPTLKGMNPETELLAVKSALEEATAQHAETDSKASISIPVGVALNGLPPYGSASSSTTGGYLTLGPEWSDTTRQMAVAADGLAAVIADGAKAGRTLSKANETKLRGAMDAIAQVLSSLGAPEDEEETEKTARTEDEATDKAREVAEVNGKSSGELELLSLIQQIETAKENGRHAVR